MTELNVIRVADGLKECGNYQFLSIISNAIFNRSEIAFLTFRIPSFLHAKK